MSKANTSIHFNAKLSMLALLALAAMVAVEPALAQVGAGGLQKVNQFMNNVLSILRGVSITVVTIAIMWAGKKMLFDKSRFQDVIPIIGGGLLIGGAAELASYLLS